MWLPYPLPFSRFALSSSLSPGEVETRLASRIAWYPTLGERTSFGIEAMFRKLEGTEVPLWFEGKVADGHFRIHRFISGRNSFVPVLDGSMQPSGSGTVLNIFARPDWLVLFAVIAWMAVVASIGWSVFTLSGSWLAVLFAFAGPAIAVASFVPQLVGVRRDLEAFIASQESQAGAV